MHCEHACLHYQMNDGVSACYSSFIMPDIMQQENSHTLPSIHVLRSAAQTSLVVCCSV